MRWDLYRKRINSDDTSDGGSATTDANSSHADTEYDPKIESGACHYNIALEMNLDVNKLINNGYSLPHHNMNKEVDKMNARSARRSLLSILPKHGSRTDQNTKEYF